MQNGSLIRAGRQTGPDVWGFRWRELAGNGKWTHRRIVPGSVDRLVDEAAARQAVSALCIDINAGDLPTGEHCPKGLICLGCAHAQPKKSAVPIFRRMLASHERSLVAAQATANLPDRSRPARWRS